MPLRYYAGMDDRYPATRLCTISPSVLHANHRILPADHGIPIPPPSPDKSKMLPAPSASTNRKEKEQDVTNFRGILMDLAEEGS